MKSTQPWLVYHSKPFRPSVHGNQIALEQSQTTGLLIIILCYFPPKMRGWPGLIKGNPWPRTTLLTKPLTGHPAHRKVFNPQGFWQRALPPPHPTHLPCTHNNNSFALPPLQHTSLNQMSYFNNFDNNAKNGGSYYPSVYGDFEMDVYPFLGPPPGFGATNNWSEFTRRKFPNR